MVDFTSQLPYPIKAAACYFAENPTACVAAETVKSLPVPSLYSFFKGCNSLWSIPSSLIVRKISSPLHLPLPLSILLETSFCKTTSSMAYYGGKQLLAGGNAIANAGWSLLGGSGELGVRDQVRQVVHLSNALGSKLDDKLTSYIAPQALTAEAANEAKIAGTTPFRATDLIGPTFFMWQCGQQSLHYLAEAYRNGKLLLSGSRNETKGYLTSNPNVAAVWNVPRYTSQLVKKTVINLGIAAGWAGLSYLTATGVRDALQDAGVTEEGRADMMATALATLCVIPTCIQILHKALVRDETKGSSPANESATTSDYPKIEYNDQLGRYVDEEGNVV